MTRRATSTTVEPASSDVDDAIDLDGKVRRQNGYTIRAFREREGLSVADLAELCATSTTHMRNIELEHRDATNAQLAKMADRFEVPVAALTRVPASRRLGRTPTPRERVD